MSPKIPESLKLEHEQLHADLVRATKAGGKTGEAAKAVAKVLHEHFIKEEEFALPPSAYCRRWRTAKSIKKCAVFWR